MSLVGGAVSVGALVVSAFLAARVFGLFFERRRPYNLMWAMGLLLFASATLIQAAAEFGGWTDGLFRAWYFFGITNVGFLGLGSVYLANRRAGHVFAVFILGITAAFGYAVAVTPTNAAVFLTWTAQGLPPTGAGWAASLPRILTPIINILGAFPLIGLALYGAVRFHLRYNMYIAAGAIILAVSTALTRFNIASLLYGGLLVGVILMFIGFEKAVEWAKEHRARSPAGGPPPREEESTAPSVETAPK